MPGTNVTLYCVRCTDGTERGPFSRTELEALAGSGGLDAGCTVCDASLRRWKKAVEYPFLSGYCQASAPEKENAAPPKERPPAFVGMVSSRLGDEGIRFSPAPVSLRLAAGLTDLLVVCAWGLAAAWLCGGPASRTAAVLWMACWYAGALLYLAASLALRGQTAGQWFWGLICCTENLRELWADRAFITALTTAGLGAVLLPTALFRAQGRSLADELTGTRVIRTRIIPDTAERIQP